MEASGGYERLAFMMLWEKGQPCALVNARNVRRFAEAMGFLEKTDDIDAGVIAQYAEVKRVCPTPLPSAAQQRLKALVSRLSQVTGDLTVNKQRRSAAADAETIASLDEIIFLLKRQQRRIEGEIASLIDDDPLWARLNEAFREIKGVASRTVARLMAEVPKSASSPTRRLPSSSAWPRSPTTAASGKADDQCAAVAKGRARSSFSLPGAQRSTIQTSLTSTKGCNRPENAKWSPASLSLASCSSFSMRKHAMRASSSPMRLTTQIVAHRLVPRCARDAEPPSPTRGEGGAAIGPGGYR